MPNFLNNCSCSIDSAKLDGIRLPIDDAVLSPWVQLTIENENGRANRVITTGNISEPEEGGGNLGSNFAVIRSFSYGLSNGFRAIVEVVDLEGGNFCNFIAKIAKTNILDVGTQSQVSFQWGWKTKNCDNSRYRIESQVHKGNIISIERQMEGGYYKFTLVIQDFSVIFQDLRIEKTYPKMTLQAAITKLMTEDVDPKVKGVLFLQRGQDGILNQPLQIKVESGGGGSQSSQGQSAGGGSGSPPPDTWLTGNLSVMSILYNWLARATSAKDRALIPVFVSREDGQYLLIKEADNTGCKNEVFPFEVPVRKYIHNGGKKSPIISFNPTVKETWARVSTSGGGFGNSTKPIKQDKNIICDDEEEDKASKVRKGAPVIHPTNPTGLGRVGKGAIAVAAKADKAARIADVAWQPIQAELVVQGDPKLDGFDLYHRRVGITVVIPFKPKSNGTTIDWGLQTSSSDSSNCDPVLTSDNYMITGVSHNISAGSYTTSIELNLIAGL